MNSISPLISLSETLLQDQQCVGEVREGLQVIHSTTRNLLTFVNTYRQFTRVPLPHCELFHVKALFERLLKLIVNEPEEKGLRSLMRLMMKSFCSMPMSHR